MTLPLDWQNKIREALLRNKRSNVASGDEPATSPEENEIAPIGFANSQDSLFSIQEDVSSPNDSD